MACSLFGGTVCLLLALIPPHAPGGQVYAISDKAKDVRGVVMGLNSQRGEREAAAACPAATEPEAVPDAVEMRDAAEPQPAPWGSFLDEQVTTLHRAQRTHESAWIGRLVVLGLVAIRCLASCHSRFQQTQQLPSSPTAMLTIGAECDNETRLQVTAVETSQEADDGRFVMALPDAPPPKRRCRGAACAGTAGGWDAVNGGVPDTKLPNIVSAGAKLGLQARLSDAR